MWSTATEAQWRQLADEVCTGMKEWRLQHPKATLTEIERALDERLARMRALHYNDVEADRNTVAVVQAMEAILQRHAKGQPGGLVEVNGPLGGLALRLPGQSEPTVLYDGRV